MTSCLVILKTSENIFSRDGYFLPSLPERKEKILLTSLNIFSSSLVCLLMQITTKKQSLEIKNRPHTTKGAHSQPLRGGFLHRRQSLFAYSYCSSSQALWPGSATRVRWWASQPGSKRVSRGSDRLVAFFSTRFLLLMRRVEAPGRRQETKKTYLNNLPWKERVTLPTSSRLIIFSWVYPKATFLSSTVMQIR